MCGIAGSFNTLDYEPHFSKAALRALKHRGPDSTGIWFDHSAGLTLLHTRLSILDLSPAGHQPMTSRCGRFTLVLNGEIYNHLELRKELEARQSSLNWLGHSDTETLLACISNLGLKRTLPKLIGMFSFALWDSSSRNLYLVRDRLGEKPLYYGQNSGAFLFASELKAFSAYPKWAGRINNDALSLYFRYNHLPGTSSIYEGVYKVPPAHCVVISEEGSSVSNPECYWSLYEVASPTSSRYNDPTSSLDSCVTQLEQLLTNSISRQMLSDVPVGAFLSGGFDSTTVVALMQKLSSKPIKTFTIGFHDQDFNEANHALDVAKYLQTDHQEIYVSPNDCLSIIPDLPEIYDEPFADSSQIPTTLLCRLAKKDVTVALCGDGADELFGGYNRHLYGPSLWNCISPIPLPLRKYFSNYIQSRDATKKFQSFISRFYPVPDLRLKLLKMASAISSESFVSFYDDIRSHCKVSPLLDHSCISYSYPESPRHDYLSRMLFLDTLTYLPGDILTKIDRASMSVGLETRVPFLDHTIVEFAWSLPNYLKVNKSTSKFIIRRLLSRHVPPSLTDRPKQGFGIPISAWLKGPLRDWAESLLCPYSLKNQGYLDTGYITTMWNDHIEDRGNNEHALWCVLMFQAWLDKSKI